MILDITIFFALTGIPNTWSEIHTPHIDPGAIGNWKSKQNLSNTVLQGPHSWCGGNDTQGFGHRLFSASDSSCVTHVSFTLSPRPPSPFPPQAKAGDSPHIFKEDVSPLTQLSRQRLHRQVSGAKGVGAGGGLARWPVGNSLVDRAPWSKGVYVSRPKYQHLLWFCMRRLQLCSIVVWTSLTRTFLRGGLAFESTRKIPRRRMSMRLFFWSSTPFTVKWYSLIFLIVSVTRLAF